MCDEKRVVTSVLRALLISKGRNGPIPLSELKRDYCKQEGKKEIPKFDHQNVSDFLLRSGEFILNVFDGEVMVREKPKSESLHIKKLVMEQKLGKHTTFVPFRNNVNHKIVPVHANKPSIVFKFDELNDILNDETGDANSLGTNSLDSQDEIKSQPDRIVKSIHEGKSRTTFCSDMLKDHMEAKSFCVASTMTGTCEEETIADARLHLLEAILPFNVVKNCSGDYCATITVNKKKYFGYGSSVEEAKNNVSQYALQFIKQKTDPEVVSRPLKNDDESSTSSNNNNYSFYSLNQMTNALQYHCHTVDGFYLSSIKVEGREYNALGVSEESAKDKVAEKVLCDKEIMLLIKLRSSTEWKLIDIFKGMHKVSVKIDGIIHYGEGCNSQSAVANCIENALKSNPYTNQTSTSFKILKEKCVGLSYETLSKDLGDKYKVMMKLDDVSYFGEGLSVQEANENAADECLKSILNGDHQRSIEARKTQQISMPNVFKTSMSGSVLQSKFNPLESYNNVNFLKDNININAVRALLLQHFQSAHFYSSLKRF